MTNSIQRRIRFLGYKIYSLTVTFPEFGEVTSADSFSLEISMNVSIDQETKRGFSLYMGVKLSSQDKGFTLELNSHSKFETESEIEEDYLNDGMVTVNAPAIVFPFIRAFINTVSTNAGYNPIILPAINFVALNQSKL